MYPKSVSRSQWHPAAALLLCLVALVLLTGTRPAAANTLQDAASKVVRTLQASGSPGLSSVRLSPVDFYDAKTRTVLPLADFIGARLIAELEGAGFKVLEGQPQVKDFWLIRCSWRRSGAQSVSLTFLASPWRNGRRGTVKAISAKVDAAELAPSLFTPDATSYGRTLMHRLGLNERLDGVRRVYIKPVAVSGQVGGNTTTQFFTEWLRGAVGESNLLVSADARREIARLDRKTLRTRGIRPKAKVGKSLAGDLVNAENELATKIELSGASELAVNAVLQDGDGGKVATASVGLPVTLLPPHIRRELTSDPSSQLTASAPVSQQGLQVELATNHGEGLATYKAGEKITFLVRVNRSAYVYLFDLDADGHATLLYPAFDVEHRPLPAGELLILPDDGLPYELEVTPPFGRDLVWIVAVEQPIAVPRELRGEWASAEGARQRVRSLAAQAGANAQAELIVETHR